MDTDDNPKAEVKKSIAAGEKLKMAIGSLAVLGLALLAGLVYTRYQAGIPPAEPAPAIANSEIIPVTISEQNLATPMKSKAGDSRPATPADEVPSTTRPAQS
jgi:hypothetical protein